MYVFDKISKVGYLPDFGNQKLSCSTILSIDFWKIIQSIFQPACLFHPAHLLNLGYFPAYTFIRETRVITAPRLAHTFKILILESEQQQDTFPYRNEIS